MNINIAELKIGDKVYYQPAHYKDNQYENGMVKEIPDHTNDSIRVVYNCAGDWNNFKDYTSALTNLRDLSLGWKNGIQPEPFGDTEPLQGDDLVKAMTTVSSGDREWYNDPRAIGLKCWFWNDNGLKRNIIGTLLQVRPEGFNEFYKAVVSMAFIDKENMYSFTNCRLAKGDKTEYDGKGQPVPDGVEVKIWFSTAGVPQYIRTQYVEWDNNNRQMKISHYQVQEQSAVEQGWKPCDRCTDYKGCEAHGCMKETKTIPTETIARVVELLETINDDGNYFLTENERVEIDTLIKELTS